jgi:uncharacterized membrane protein YraQ (UPF0718 family)
MAASKLPESDEFFLHLDATLFYWLAGILVASIVGFVIFGLMRRKRRRRSSWEQSESLRSKLGAPVRQARSIRRALKEALRERKKREERAEQRRHSTRH